MKRCLIPFVVPLCLIFYWLYQKLTLSHWIDFTHTHTHTNIKNWLKVERSKSKSEARNDTFEHSMCRIFIILPGGRRKALTLTIPCWKWAHTLKSYSTHTHNRQVRLNNKPLNACLALCCLNPFNAADSKEGLTENSLNKASCHNTTQCSFCGVRRVGGDDLPLLLQKIGKIPKPTDI